MDSGIYFFLAGGALVALVVAVYFKLYDREKPCPVVSSKQDKLEAIAIMIQLKSLLAEKGNEELADRLAGCCGDYAIPDCEKAKTQEEATALRREMTQLEEYISALGLCGMFYKTGMITHQQMYYLLGERIGDICENKQLCKYLHEYHFFYEDVLFLLRHFR